MPVNYKGLLSDKSILLLLAIALFAMSITRHHKNPSTVLQSDAKGYYMYLPSFFVYKNIHSVPDVLFQGQTKNNKGETYIKYPCGTAYCFLPFFLAAHIYTGICGTDRSGFSDPYYYSIMICGVFWAIMGICLLKKILARYFSRLVTWATILCILLGTNFFNYATYEVGMSHIYSFALFAGIILAVDTYYRQPSYKLAALTGTLFGWIVLIRNTNAALLIFLLLLHTVTTQDIKIRLRFFRQHYTHLLLALVCMMIVVIPQFLYWKEMTGQWTLYSYKGETFSYLRNPKIAQVLFDTQNGLFTYAPVLFFFIWGLFRKKNDQRTNFTGVSITFIFITYLFASWWGWWFGGAFGHRCYVEYYTILAFPLAVALEHILTLKSFALKSIILLCIGLFCYYNLRVSHLYFYFGPFDGPQWVWNWDKWYNELVREIF